MVDQHLDTSLGDDSAHQAHLMASYCRFDHVELRLPGGADDCAGWETPEILQQNSQESYNPNDKTC